MTSSSITSGFDSAGAVGVATTGSIVDAAVAGTDVAVAGAAVAVAGIAVGAAAVVAVALGDGVQAASVAASRISLAFIKINPLIESAYSYNLKLNATLKLREVY